MFRVKLDRFERNPAGFRELLRGGPMQADLRRRAQAIDAGAGPGHEVRTSVGAHRARAVVITTTFEARKALAESKALIRAIDRGRG